AEAWVQINNGFMRSKIANQLQDFTRAGPRRANRPARLEMASGPLLILGGRKRRRIQQKRFLFRGFAAQFGPEQKQLRRILAEDDGLACWQIRVEITGELTKPWAISHGNLGEIPPHEQHRQSADQGVSCTGNQSLCSELNLGE